MRRYSFYKKSYNKARLAFRQKADFLKQKYPKAKRYVIKVPSMFDDDLTVDLLYIPPVRDADKLLILSSGVHGIEGLAGHAVQMMFSELFTDDILLQQSGVLFIHAVNPYGFKYMKRVTENNVDLNRNCSDNPELFASVNRAYSTVNSFINPEEPVRLTRLDNLLFYFHAADLIRRKGISTLRQAILQGQYHFPKGLYYGGSRPEPQIEKLKPILQDICADYNIILAIDLHTGYGERGKLHFFPNPVEPDLKRKTEFVFKDYEINWGDTDKFYTMTGDFVNYIKEINPKQTVIPMVFEYGTMNNQTIKGSVKAVKTMILENQGRHYGYRSKTSELKVKLDFKKMYFPMQRKWRKKIIADSRLVFKTILPRFYKLNIDG